MKANPDIDELLCSFLDGELPLRQQTEVQRLVARDPDVARRLRQLQSCQTLISALPRVEAPAEILEQTRFSLERRTLLAEPAVSIRASAGARHLMVRKLVAAAAMIALLAVLGAVVYQIVAPVPNAGVQLPVAGGPQPPRVEIDRGVATPMLAADSGFAGRLEIRTAKLVQTEASITRAIEENGLAGFVESDIAGNTRVYRVASTRAGVNRLIASLGDIWQNFDAVTLHVDRPDLAPTAPAQYVTGVTVEAVTPDQALTIVTREPTQASIETARNFAVANAMAQDMPGGEVLSLMRDDTASARDLATIIRPRLTETITTTLAPPQGEIDASLTITLLSTR
jgi:hypothetical protein